MRLCMCSRIQAVLRDGKSTCVICGGEDAYGAAGRLAEEAQPKPLRLSLWSAIMLIGRHLQAVKKTVNDLEKRIKALES